eukprot:8417246-Alexandrium_andersonii.AAC.1
MPRSSGRASPSGMCGAGSSRSRAAASSKRMPRHARWTSCPRATSGEHWATSWSTSRTRSGSS